MRLAATVAAALALALAAAPARADGGFSHRYQFGAYVQGGIGYRGIFPYDQEYCGQVGAGGGTSSNCLSRSPFSIELGGSYGVTASLEVFGQVRLGLEPDFGTAPGKSGPNQVALSPGIKLYLAELGASQFFATLELPIDLSSYAQSDKVDLGFRNINGLMFDAGRRFGVYFYFGEQVSWRRWLRFEIEAGLGSQVRF